MAYEEINPSMWTYHNEGDFVEGVLVDVQDDVGQNKSKMYTIETKDGILNIWGSTILDARMPLVKLGEKVKITYKGLGVSKAGKNPPKIFKVEVDRG